MEPNKDNDQDKQSQPGIPPPGKQLDQQQQPNAPPQPQSRQSGSSQWTPPSGNPDLYPAGHTQRIDLRERNPLEPQGMLYDPRQLLDHQRANRPDVSGVPEGARFDPFGPPDPDLVGPGRGPRPSGAFANPDPDLFMPPGQQQPPQLARKSLKSLKDPTQFPPGPPSGRPGGGLGGGPFGGGF